MKSSMNSKLRPEAVQSQYRAVFLPKGLKDNDDDEEEEDEDSVRTGWGECPMCTEVMATSSIDNKILIKYPALS